MSASGQDLQERLYSRGVCLSVCLSHCDRTAPTHPAVFSEFFSGVKTILDVDAKPSLLGSMPLLCSAERIKSQQHVRLIMCN